jgi:hypothetical protein
MSAADSSENCRTAVLAGRSGWRSIPWIAAAEYRLHLRLYAAHRWATKLGVVEGSSLYRILATALDQLLVLAKSAI